MGEAISLIDLGEWQWVKKKPNTKICFGAFVRITMLCIGGTEYTAEDGGTNTKTAGGLKRKNMKVERWIFHSDYVSTQR